MAKKKKPVVEEPVVEEPEVIEEEEEVTCPVCGKPVGVEVMSCPHCGAEFEAEEPEPAAQAQAEDPEEEMAACPVCHKMVSLAVSSCPYCGAEFETEEEAPAKAAPAPVEYVEQEEMAECPVCGKMVALDVASCPSCGAEFEEEEVEEIIEVEEKPVARAAPRIIPAEEEFVEEEVEVEAEEAVPEIEGPTSIMDLRVIGISLIVLGILGSQISFMIDWYWTWVPPIGDNLGMFIAIPAVIIVVGLLAFLLVKRAIAGGKKVRKPMPGMALSMFLTGILVLVMVMLWSPINSALQDSNIAVGIVFVAMLFIGILAVVMGIRASSRATAG